MYSCHASLLTPFWLCLRQIEVVIRHMMADHQSGIPAANYTVTLLTYPEARPMIDGYQLDNPKNHFVSLRDAYTRSMAHGMNQSKFEYLIDELCEADNLRAFESDIDKFRAALQEGDI